MEIQAQDQMDGCRLGVQLRTSRLFSMPDIDSRHEGQPGGADLGRRDNKAGCGLGLPLLLAALPPLCTA